jgi:hypothetical protein
MTGGIGNGYSTPTDKEIEKAIYDARRVWEKLGENKYKG